MKICKVVGCGKGTTGYSDYCSSHKNHRRRHGHAQQEAIRLYQLKSYLTLVRKRIAMNAESPLWPILEERTTALVQECKTEIRKPTYIRWQRTAAEEFLKVAEHVPGRSIIETVAAMLYMREEEEWRFKSDDSFWVQVSRRIRALADVNCGTKFDHRKNKVLRVYRDIHLKAAIAFGRLVISAVGVACLRIVKLDTAEKERAERDKAVYREALGSLQ